MWEQPGNEAKRYAYYINIPVPVNAFMNTIKLYEAFVTTASSAFLHPQ